MDSEMRKRILRRYLHRPWDALQWRLKGLELEQGVQDVYHQHDPHIQAAKDNRDYGQHLINDLFSELRAPQANLAAWESERWERKASRYHVQIPTTPKTEDANEYWERSDGGDRWILTERGKAEIRRHLRDELQWRRERWTGIAGTIASLFGAATGLVGAMIGWWAVSK